MLTVGDILKKKAVVVHPEDTVHKVAVILSKAKVGSAVVIDDDEIIGIITDRDILDKVVVPGKNPKKVRVREIMTEKPVTIEDDFTLQDAVERMSEKGVRRLLVTRLGKPLGFVTAADILAALSREKPETEESLENVEPEIYGYCEICGQYGLLYKVYIEGEEKWVCESCKDSLEGQ